MRTTQTDTTQTDTTQTETKQHRNKHTNIRNRTKNTNKEEARK